MARLIHITSAKTKVKNANTIMHCLKTYRSKCDIWQRVFLQQCFPCFLI